MAEVQARFGTASIHTGVKWISNALRYILFSLSSGSLPQAFPIYILHIISEPVSLDKPDFMKRL